MLTHEFTVKLLSVWNFVEQSNNCNHYYDMIVICKILQASQCHSLGDKRPSVVSLKSAKMANAIKGPFQSTFHITSR